MDPAVPQQVTDKAEIGRASSEIADQGQPDARMSDNAVVGPDGLTG
jgi:hypothetical protein